MRTRTLVIGLALLGAALVPQAVFAQDGDPLGLLAGARGVQNVVKRGRQGMYTASWATPEADRGLLSLSVLRLHGRGLGTDLFAFTGRTRPFAHLWMSASISQPAARAPEASFGLNWETGPVAWALTAATDRPSSYGLLPGADLSGTWRF